MNFHKTRLIYFSPTRTTKKIMEGISLGIQADTTAHMDLTALDARSQIGGTIDDDLVVFGVPVYAGRVPKVAAEGLSKLKGSNVPCAVVVVYGNREYEDALLELRDLVSKAGFTPIAGGAFIGEHSFSTEAKPIAPDRPDSDDSNAAKRFGEMIQKKLSGIDTLDGLPPLEVPGNFPYKERPNRPPISPVTRDKTCTLCGECATACPTEVITVADSVETNPEGCIICCACVKGCPTGARVMSAEPILQIADWLYTNYSEPKKPETFI